MRVFKNGWFQKFARKEKISDAMLCEAVARAERGQIDADHGPERGGQLAGRFEYVVESLPSLTTIEQSRVDARQLAGGGVADVIAYALNAPGHVNLDLVTMRPVAQSAQHLLARGELRPRD